MLKSVVKIGVVVGLAISAVRYGYSKGYEDGVKNGEQIGSVRTLIQEGYSLEEVARRVQSADVHEHIE